MGNGSPERGLRREGILRDPQRMLRVTERLSWDQLRSGDDADGLRAAWLR